MKIADHKKLNTIIGKLEALQYSTRTKTREEAEAMSKAKTLLMEILQY
tara:strand:+ start:340 stop:483 length:144 start_codon:yes stop_codon:yes gene_type:complete